METSREVAVVSIFSGRALCTRRIGLGAGGTGFIAQEFLGVEGEGEEEKEEEKEE